MGRLTRAALWGRFLDSGFRRKDGCATGKGGHGTRPATEGRSGMGSGCAGTTGIGRLTRAVRWTVSWIPAFAGKTGVLRGSPVVIGDGDESRVSGSNGGGWVPACAGTTWVGRLTRAVLWDRFLDPGFRRKDGCVTGLAGGDWGTGMGTRVRGTTGEDGFSPARTRRKGRHEGAHVSGVRPLFIPRDAS